MRHEASEILAILDAACGAFTFPMLDNGYVYLAATRLALFRSDDDWAMTIEVFGFSPAAGAPHTQVSTFASTLRNRKPASAYVSGEAHRNFLLANPNNDSHFVYPFDDEAWLDDDGEFVAENMSAVGIRGRLVALPAASDYRKCGIDLQHPPRATVFEACRALAETERAALLATDEELRHHVPGELVEILRLDEWFHPDVVDPADRPSRSPAFRQLADVLASGDPRLYAPTRAPNTHWRHWPAGGTL